MNALPALTPVGRVGRRHGTRGELTLQLTRPLEDEEGEVPDCLFLTIDGLPVPHFIDEWRGRGGTSLIVKFDGVDTEVDASALTGCEVGVESDWLGEEPDLAHTMQALTGYTVEQADGTPLGTVTAVDDRSQNLLLLVATPQGGELLLPLHENLLVHFDPAARLLRLEVPQGLLNLNE